MALVLDESFATAIPANFATPLAQAGTLTATYNPTAQAVDLSNSAAGQSIWDITSTPLTVAGEMELDLEWLADLSGPNNYRHAGLWAVAGQAVGSNGFRFGHYQSDWRLSRWDGTWWAGNGGETIVQQGAADTFNVLGDRRLLNLRWDMRAGAGVSRLSVEARIDGVLRLVTASTFPSLRPGVFIYQSTVRLHSIKVWDAPLAPLAALGFQGLQPTQGRGVYTVPEATPSGVTSSRMTGGVGRLDSSVPQAKVRGGAVGYYRGQKLWRRNMYLGGNGRIVGSVAIKGSPNTPVQRRVRLFNEKTGMLVREVFSDPATGAYEFLYVSMDHKYTVVTFDYDNNYRAVVADNISAEFAP
jgi:hypothetical protein